MVAGVVELVGPLNDALAKIPLGDREASRQSIALAHDGAGQPEVEFLGSDDVVGQLGDFDAAATGIVAKFRPARAVDDGGAASFFVPFEGFAIEGGIWPLLS